MAKTRINMITIMNEAWKDRCNNTHDQFEVYVKNLLSHSYATIQSAYVDYCRSRGQEDDQRIFLAYQRVFIFLMLSDGDFLQGEYDAYCKFCNYAEIKPLTVSRIRELYNDWSIDVLIREITFLAGFRDALEPSDFSAMVRGFCFMSLCGDKSFDENEYYILRCFFDSDYDYVPSTWEQFKREWK